jgi:hypothetical protein
VKEVFLYRSSQRLRRGDLLIMCAGSGLDGDGPATVDCGDVNELLAYGLSPIDAKGEDSVGPIRREKMDGTLQCDRGSCRNLLTDT